MSPRRGDLRCDISSCGLRNDVLRKWRSLPTVSGDVLLGTVEMLTHSKGRALAKLMLASRQLSAKCRF